jgi:hypothetical protein
MDCSSYCMTQKQELQSRPRNYSQKRGLVGEKKFADRREFKRNGDVDLLPTTYTSHVHTRSPFDTLCRIHVMTARMSTVHCHMTPPERSDATAPLRRKNMDEVEMGIQIPADPIVYAC